MTRSRIFLCSVAGVTASLLVFGAVGASCTSGAPGISLNPALEETLGVDASIEGGGGSSGAGGSGALGDGGIDASPAPPGTTCSSDGECASGFCVTGYCCPFDCTYHCAGSWEYLPGTCNAAGECLQEDQYIGDLWCATCGIDGSTSAEYLGYTDYNCNRICPNAPAEWPCLTPGAWEYYNGACSGGYCVPVAEPNGFTGCVSGANCQSGICNVDPESGYGAICCATPCEGVCNTCGGGPASARGVCGPSTGGSCLGGTCECGVCVPADAGTDSGTGGSSSAGTCGAGTSSSTSGGTSSGVGGAGATSSGMTSSTTTTGTGGAATTSSGATSSTTTTGTGGAGTTSSGATTTTSAGVGGSVATTTTSTTNSGTGSSVATTTTSATTSSGVASTTGAAGHPGSGGADTGAVVTSTSCALTPGPTTVGPWAGLLLGLLLRRRQRR